MTAAASIIERDDTLWDPTLEARANVHAWLGRAVGSQYVIVEHLASGGMGHVFLAEHRALHAQAAVKVLASRRSPALTARFFGEAQILSTINHPNIVKVFDAGELADASPYILMEYVPGVELGALVDRGQLRSVKRVLGILRKIARALDHLHGQGIVHRDIKPANIIVDAAAQDAVKLVDFGIAIREGAPASELEHGLLGTPAYMAPEQITGSSCDRAIDLYAFGALALELLTGKPPYDYPSLNLVLAAVLHERPSLPSSRGIHFPGFDAVFERALAREPADRFPTADALIDALAAVFLARPVERPGVRPSQAPDLATERGRQLGTVCRGAVALACGAVAWLA